MDILVKVVKGLVVSVYVGSAILDALSQASEIMQQSKSTSTATKHKV